MTTELEDAEAAFEEAARRRQEAWRNAQIEMGYPEFDSKEWREHQRELALRYHSLQRGQRIRMTGVPGIHGAPQFGSPDGEWIVTEVANGRVMLHQPGHRIISMVEYGVAWPFGPGPFLRELEIIE